MAKVNPDEHKRNRPKVTLADLEGAEAMALTVATAEILDMEDRRVMAVTFEETGDKVHFPNATSLGYIVERLGDESDDWIGHYLPLVRHQGTYNGKTYDNLQVAAPELWNTIIRDSGFDVPAKFAEKVVAPAPRPRAAVKRPAPRGRK